MQNILTYIELNIGSYCHIYDLLHLFVFVFVLFLKSGRLTTFMKIKELTIRAKNLSRQLKFYVEQLGFEMIAKTEDSYPKLHYGCTMPSSLMDLGNLSEKHWKIHSLHRWRKRAGKTCSEPL